MERDYSKYHGYFKLEITHGQLRWLMDLPEYKEAVEHAKRTQGPLYGVLASIIAQFHRQAVKQGMKED